MVATNNFPNNTPTMNASELIDGIDGIEVLDDYSGGGKRHMFLWDVLIIS